MKEILSQYFEADQLLIEHGGTSEQTWEYPGWPREALTVDPQEIPAEKLQPLLLAPKPAPAQSESRQSGWGWSLW